MVGPAHQVGVRRLRVLVAGEAGVESSVAGGTPERAEHRARGVGVCGPLDCRSERALSKLKKRRGGCVER